MKTYHDCLPCLVRQALDAVRFATQAPAVHEKSLREVLTALGTIDLDQSPPQMGQVIHRIIRKHTGDPDPYRIAKKRSNAHALELVPRLKALLKASQNSFETAVRFAIAGNIIDFGLQTEINQDMIHKAVEESLAIDLFGETKTLQEAIGTAEKILYIGDNAGEIVFDRLLIELLPHDKIIFAVRGGPVINDATLEDAKKVGMTDLVKVIDNGDDAPGTILEECAEGFRRTFQEADLIISKGQGNFETLSSSGRPIFFLLKAKCPVIVEHIGCRLGDAVIGQGRAFRKGQG